MRNVAGEASVRDGLHDRAVLNLLGGADFVAAGNASGVEVAEDADVGADGVDQIAFHNLHVVDVVEQFDARGIDLVHDVRAPRGVVGHVVGVVDFAVEQFEADRDAVVFSDLLDAVEAEDGIARAYFVGQAAASCRKT